MNLDFKIKFWNESNWCIELNNNITLSNVYVNFKFCLKYYISLPRFFIKCFNTFFFFFFFFFFITYLLYHYQVGHMSSGRFQTHVDLEISPLQMYIVHNSRSSSQWATVIISQYIIWVLYIWEFNPSQPHIVSSMIIKSASQSKSRSKVISTMYICDVWEPRISTWTLIKTWMWGNARHKIMVSSHSIMVM